MNFKILLKVNSWSEDASFFMLANKEIICMFPLI